MKELGYKSKIIDGYVVVSPSNGKSKEPRLKESEKGTGKPVGRISLSELRSFLMK